jgi:hypothetical protein
MARKMMKKPSAKHEDGQGIMPKQFAGKKPMVKGGDGKKSKDMGRGMGMKSREKRLEGKAL